MKKLAILVLTMLGPSCGSTSGVLFIGQDVATKSGFAVAGKKETDRIIVMNIYLGFGLQLPYAEDWTFNPTEQKPVSGLCPSRRLFVTVQGHRPGRPVEEEAYLRDEYLKNLNKSWVGRGIAVGNVAIAKQGEHFVLEYATDAKTPEGMPVHQVHFWTFRQRDDGMIYEAHVSTVTPNEPELGEMCKTLRQILGNNFQVMPLPKEK